ncbi:MAG: hypothetical protein WAV25_03265 [Minisyncoccia bacterium]
MDPKFQSSFIPKGPVASPASFAAPKKSGGLFGFIASVIFFIAVVISAGLFGYEKYLLSSIAQRGDDLKQAKEALNPDLIKDLLKLNSRINSTQDILSKHTVLSPLFDFLESTTYKSVRYTSFKFTNDKELTISMGGQARGYAAVALQADTLSRSKYIKNPVFSDLLLDDKGNVLFSFKATLNPEIISYKRQVESGELQTTTPPVVVPTTIDTSAAAAQGTTTTPKK